MKHPTGHWHEDAAVQDRRTGRFGGVDHGSKGKVMAETRNENEIHRRLVWFGGHRSPAAGVRGFGHTYHPSHLTVIDRGGYWQASIFSGGRISKERIAEHAAQIDEQMGEGVTALIDPKRTLVVVYDENGENSQGG